VDPIVGRLHSSQRPTAASPARQQASSMWTIVSSDSASGDDGFFALVSLVVLGLAVHCGD
jgi:hypothetical protein